MNDRMFGIVARHAADVVSRRGSLRVLGAVALAGALGNSTAASAGEAGKKASKRCKRQRGGCEEVAKANCAASETCLNALLPCCALLAQCKGREATECFLSG